MILGFINCWPLPPMKPRYCRHAGGCPQPCWTVLGRMRLDHLRDGYLDDDALQVDARPSVSIVLDRRPPDWAWQAAGVPPVRRKQTSTLPHRAGGGAGGDQSSCACPVGWLGIWRVRRHRRTSCGGVQPQMQVSAWATAGWWPPTGCRCPPPARRITHRR